MITGCSTAQKTGTAPGADAQLKVNGANSQLTAKVLVKNNTKKEMILSELNSKYFVVQTNDGKAVEARPNSGKSVAPLKIKPGETAEAVFSLQNNYSFWDRLTKYKIAYDGPGLKTAPVQVWF